MRIKTRLFVQVPVLNLVLSVMILSLVLLYRVSTGLYYCQSSGLYYDTKMSVFYTLNDGKYTYHSTAKPDDMKSGGPVPH